MKKKHITELGVKERSGLFAAAGREAVEATRKAGLPLTGTRNGKIIRTLPNGQEEILKVLSRTSGTGEGYSATIEYKDYLAEIEQDIEDNILVGRVVGIKDGINFHGDNMDEIVTAFIESIEDYLAACKKLGTSPEKSRS